MQDINQFQFCSRRTVNPEGDTLVNYSLGLCGEAGEIADIIKKCEFQGHNYNSEIIHKLSKELGDVMWYVSNLAYKIGANMSDILKINEEKLQKRFPNGFEAIKSIERTE